MTIAGVLCTVQGFGCTINDEGTLTDHDIKPPASIKDRGEALDWLLSEAERHMRENGVRSVRLEVANGTSAERAEVEACVKIAAHRAGAPLETLTTEQIRARHNVKRGNGAFKELLKRPDVAARSNSGRRHQFLLATAPTK